MTDVSDRQRFRIALGLAVADTLAQTSNVVAEAEAGRLDVRAGRPLARGECVRVWLWLAHLMSVEAGSVLYAYPRPDGWEEASERAAFAADRFHAKAAEVNGGRVTDGQYQAALDDFDGASARQG